MAPALGRSRRGVAVGLLLLPASVLTVFLGVREATSTPAPVIHVRWSSALMAEQRQLLEEEMTLVNPRQLGGHTWRYDLLDSRTESLRRIVHHPAVADTHDVDRERLTLTVKTEAGPTQRWLWHRWGSVRTERLILMGLAGATAASAAGLVWVFAKRGVAD